jgi:WD40 repeat protein
VTEGDSPIFVRGGDVATRREAVTRHLNDSGVAHQMSISSDGRWLAGASSLGGASSVRVWDLVSGDVAWSVEGHDLVLGLAFSPDGRLAVAGAGGSVQLWAPRSAPS